MSLLNSSAQAHTQDGCATRHSIQLRGESFVILRPQSRCAPCPSLSMTYSVLAEALSVLWHTEVGHTNICVFANALVYAMTELDFAIIESKFYPALWPNYNPVSKKTITILKLRGLPWPLPSLILTYTRNHSRLSSLQIACKLLEGKYRIIYILSTIRGLRSMILVIYGESCTAIAVLLVCHWKHRTILERLPWRFFFNWLNVDYLICYHLRCSVLFCIRICQKYCENLLISKSSFKGSRPRHKWTLITGGC